MPTLGEACQQLRIGRVTLAKWIRRLGIETTRHEWDYRFHTISADELQRIKDARAQMPGAQTGVQHINKYLYDALRAKSDEGTVRDVSPMIAPAPRPRPRVSRVSSEGSLPDGLVSLTAAAEAHGIVRYLSTLRRWRDEGRLEHDPGEYSGEHGQFAVSRPLTHKGLAQLVELASHKYPSEFTRCDRCPHAEGE